MTLLALYQLRLGLWLCRTALDRVERASALPQSRTSVAALADSAPAPFHDELGPLRRAFSCCAASHTLPNCGSGKRVGPHCPDAVCLSNHRHSSLPADG